MAHPIAISHLSFFEASPPEAVDITAEVGFRALGFRLLPAAPDEVPFPLVADKRLLQETVRHLKETGVTASDVEIVRLKPDSRPRDFLPLLETAAALSARHVLVAADDPDRARIIDNFAAFASLAAPYGLTVDLEFMPWTEAPDIAAAREIIVGAVMRNAGILVDNLHLDRSDSTLDDVSRLPVELLNYAQICDAPAAYSRRREDLIHVARNERQLPGDGGLDLTGFLQSLPPDITISVEVPQRTLARSVGPRERARRALEATKIALEAAGRQWA